MANQDAPDFEERIVNVGPLFVAYAQPTELVQPAYGPLDDPSMHPEPASMLAVATGNPRFDAYVAQRVTVGLRIVRTIGVKLIESKSRLTWFAPNRWHFINQWKKLRHIVSIGFGKKRHDGYAIGVCQQMMLRATFSTVHRAWTGQFAPPKASTVELSTAAREKSIWSALRRWSSSFSRIFSHTPASCQSRSRRQQVIPQPQPISCGRYSHWIPV